MKLLFIESRENDPVVRDHSELFVSIFDSYFERIRVSDTVLLFCRKNHKELPLNRLVKAYRIGGPFFLVGTNSSLDLLELSNKDTEYWKSRLQR